jgi:hypothetical protein
MVRHEAVSPDLDSMAVAPFRQQSHVEEVIVRTEERPLSTVTALRDVVWQGGDDGAGHASHGDRVPTIPRMQLGRVTYRSGESATHASWHGVAYGVPRSPQISSHGAGVPSIPRMRVRTSYVLDRRVSNSRELAWSCVWCPQISPRSHDL